MDKILDFMRSNALSLVIGALFYALFLYYNTSGSQLCDCESTENYKPSSVHSRGAVNRFYHK
jgi:hypothetical protein